jgi:hypothetical protein
MTLERVREQSANAHFMNLCLMEAARSGTRLPPVEMVGRAHLEDANGAGQGVVLWVAPLVFAPLFAKVAFAQAGYRATHLSRSTHGFSNTRFGTRFLNPIWVAAENRFLNERLVITPQHPNRALRDLTTCVRSGGIVSVTFSGEGSRNLPVRISGREHRVPTGVVALCRRTGAALLPVLTVRTHTGTIETRIEAPLDLSGPDGDAVSRRCVNEYAALAETALKSHPDQHGAL